MKTVILNHPYAKEDLIDTEIVLALGFFDGVHLGHQRVIERALQIGKAKGYSVAVLTFNHTPQVIFEKIHPHEFDYLTDLSHKMTRFEALGVDIVYVADFTWDLAHLSPEEFVEQYIVALGAKEVVAGFDYTYGPREIANMSTLPLHSQGRFLVHEASPLLIEGQKIASSTIRQLLLQSNIQEANQALGYIYQTSGQVINGEKRGRTLGFPTANIASDYNQVIPGIGVYAVELKLKDHWYPAMASIGYNVTFKALEEPSIEVNIFDFDRMIYGEHVEIRWHSFLRPELKFDSAQGLIDQLNQDRVNSLAYFKQL